MAAMNAGDADDIVGQLLFRHPDHPEVYSPIRENGHFDIGRAEFHRAWNLNEPTISTHHLRFRCVMYEDGGENYVPPMIYTRVLSSNSVRLERAETSLDMSTAIISKADGDILLNHGDVLRLTSTISLRFEAEEECDAIYHKDDYIRTAEIKRFSNQFVVSGRKLGAGAQASVLVAVKQPSKQQVACKVVPLPFTQFAAVARIQKDPNMTQKQREAALKAIENRLVQNRQNMTREYDVLKNLDHPNIIRLEKVIYASYNIYIFEELITGGDLMSYMDLKGTLTEAHAAIIVHQLLKAVDYLHSKGVVHRDLKPENILMTSWRDGARIVVTDFGQSRTLEEAKRVAKDTSAARMYSVVGTHGYTAPEALKDLKKDVQAQGYSKAIDIWSVGCISSLLLSGDMIFNEEYEVYKNKDENLSFTIPSRMWDLSVLDEPGPWSDVGRKAKSFVKGCLVFDETQRLTAKQALLHAWFTNKHYARELAAAYERAIQDWKPRNRSGTLVEFINTTDVVPAASRPEHVHRLVEEVRSRHFETPIPSTIPFKFMHANMRPARRKDATPLPAISEVEADTIEVPASPPDRNSALSEAASSCGLNYARKLSIEALGPPNTQLMLPPAASGPSHKTSAGRTHLQEMVDGN